MAKDYRRLYEQHLGMLLPKEMHVHHIDHNKLNNNTENLVAIPFDLHGRYHFLERRFQAHTGILRYKRPSKRILEKYSIKTYMSGDWRSFFKGCDSDFLEQVQNYKRLVEAYANHDAAKSAYLECKKLVLDYKKQQSKTRLIHD